jgi:hypothetical protein
MAHTFNYAIIKAIPDQRRGERVNVGIVVFHPDYIDLRFSDLAKLRALQGGNWDQYAADACNRIAGSFNSNEKPQAFLQRISLVETVLRFSDVAWFSIENVNQYEGELADILATLVTRPRPAQRVKTTRINTEIARTFRTAGVLAAPGEGIDAHRVVQNYSVSQADDLTADFAVKNGAWHVVATLDLRRANVGKGQAAIKAITLDRADQAFSGTVRKYGVYAAPADADQFRPHIHLLREYADNVYNWLDQREREAYMRAIYSAMRSPTPLGL